MTNGEKTTFWKFLSEYSITIPIIQRDYAQGREGKEELRKRFLKDLKDAIADNSPLTTQGRVHHPSSWYLKDAIADNSPLTMDFAYGSFKSKVFYPLDGQQRLTTLWLVHWYIAYMAGQLPQVKSTLQKFSYATRVSARDFCHMLCELSTLREGKTLEDHIRNQNWFYSAWNQDPTIQSMLRMLSGTGKEDGIVEVMRSDDYAVQWTMLIDDKCLIDFRILDVSSIGQTDDLYVKMNARGKALTSFENFKAELVNYIHLQAIKDINSKELRKYWEQLDSPEYGFGQKLDNAWTNIFWTNKSSGYNKKQQLNNRIDEIFFAFMNRIWYNESIVRYQQKDGSLITASDFESKAKYGVLYANSTDDWKLAFDNLNVYVPEEQTGHILDILSSIGKTLDNFKLYREQNLDISPSWEYPTFYFIPQYLGNDETTVDMHLDEIACVKSISQPERCVFFAVCKFFEKIPEDMQGRDIDQLLNNWLRVVWNLVENADVSTVSTMVTTIRFINKLTDHIFVSPYGILSFLASESVYQTINIDSNNPRSQLERQFVEECQKAKL